MEHHDHISEALAAIDAELGRKPVTIEESILEAERAGRMDHDEAQKCLEAYERNLSTGKKIWRSIYETYDDGATSPSTYDSLFSEEDQ